MGERDETDGDPWRGDPLLERFDSQRPGRVAAFDRGAGSVHPLLQGFVYQGDRRPSFPPMDIPEAAALALRREEPGQPSCSEFGFTTRMRPAGDTRTPKA